MFKQVLVLTVAVALLSASAAFAQTTPRADAKLESVPGYVGGVEEMPLFFLSLS
jgi:hypothetical protein